MGPGQYPQCTSAWYARVAVGSSSQQHSTALTEAKLQHGSRATVEHSPNSIRSVPRTCKDETVCPSLFRSRSGDSKSNIKDPGRRSAVQVVQRVPDPVTDTVMDNLVVRRWCPFHSRGADGPGDRRDSAREVPGVLGEGEDYRHVPCGATPGADDSEGARGCRSTPGATHRQGDRHPYVQRPVPTREQQQREDVLVMMQRQDEFTVAFQG